MNVIYEEVKNPRGKISYIFVNLTAQISGVKSKKIIKYHIEKVVVKGTVEQIKKSKYAKFQFLKRIFDGSSNIKKKINDFDLSRIKIINVEIIKGLGYGIKLD